MEDSKAHQDRQETKDHLAEKEMTGLRGHQDPRQVHPEVVDRQGLGNLEDQWQWMQTSPVSRPPTLHLHLPK